MICVVAGIVTLASVGGVLLGLKLTEGKRAFRGGGKLLGESDRYVVATTIETPEGNLGYLEVTTPDGNYTEYKANTEKDSKSNGGVTSGSDYMLYDWLTTGGSLYTLNSSYEENSTTSNMWMSMPEAYSKLVSSRKTLYFKELGSGMRHVKKGEEKDVDLGYSTKSKVQEYTCDITSSSVKSMLGIDTLGLYNSLLAEAKSKGDKNMQNLMEGYITKQDDKLTFSDGTMTFQIFEGKLVGYSIDCGGLGSTMKISKTLIMSEVELRALPDFESSVGEYYTTVKSYADYVSGYDSEDEAKEALEKTTPN